MKKNYFTIIVLGIMLMVGVAPSKAQETSTTSKKEELSKSFSTFWTAYSSVFDNYLDAYFSRLDTTICTNQVKTKGNKNNGEIICDASVFLAAEVSYQKETEQLLKEALQTDFDQFKTQAEEIGLNKPKKVKIKTEKASGFGFKKIQKTYTKLVNELYREYEPSSFTMSATLTTLFTVIKADRDARIKKIQGKK